MKDALDCAAKLATDRALRKTSDFESFRSHMAKMDGLEISAKYAELIHQASVSLATAAILALEMDARGEPIVWKVAEEWEFETRGKKEL